MPEKKLIQIKLNLDLWERLRQASQADGRSITNYITRLIEAATKEVK